MSTDEIEDGNRPAYYQKKLAYYQAVVGARIQNSVDQDKSLLSLSSGGIGLMVALVTATNVSLGLPLVFFCLATGCWVAAIMLCIKIFRVNTEYLDAIIIENEGETGKISRLDKRLTTLDKWLIRCFISGVILAVVGAGTSISSMADGGQFEMAGEKKMIQGALSDEQKRNHAGLHNLAPTGQTQTGSSNGESSSSDGQGEKENGSQGNDGKSSSS